MASYVLTRRVRAGLTMLLVAFPGALLLGGLLAGSGPTQADPNVPRTIVADVAAAARLPASAATAVSRSDSRIQLCQWCESAWPRADHCPNDPFGQGAYVRPGRMKHVPAYRLRVDDVLELVYRRTRDEISEYRLNVGDRIRIELMADKDLTRELDIQGDGTITLPMVGQVPASRLTLNQLRSHLEKAFKKFYPMPTVTITPLKTDTKLIDVINTVDSRAGQGGQFRVARVAPDGTITLPVIGMVHSIGLTLDELKAELTHRYRQANVLGLEVQPILQARAPRHVFVLGEVRQPGRYTLEGPTTVIQAIALAQGITSAAAANLHQVVVLRRCADWRMIATMVDLHDPIVKGGAKCAPVCDLWVADSDIVIVPKTKILIFDEFVELIFTRGIYGVLPLQSISLNFAKASTL